MVGGAHMPKTKWNLNTIYISERLQRESAAHLPQCFDHGGCSHGLRKDNGSKLVSG